jgi:hypothetical protein
LKWEKTVENSDRFKFYIQKNPVNFENNFGMAACIKWVEDRIKAQTGYMEKDPTDDNARKLQLEYQVCNYLFRSHLFTP